MANVSGALYDYDRERGIFTPRDRRFLAGELDDELTENQKRQKRYRLRKRMAHAIQDLAYLGEMETRDLGQLSEMMNLTAPHDGDPPPAPDPDARRRLSRGLLATNEAISLFRELHNPGVFENMVRDQLGIRAALDHYDETGKYGVFSVTVDVKLKDEITIGELEALPLREVEPLEPPFDREKYYGWWQVLDRAGADTTKDFVEIEDTEHPPPTAEDIDSETPTTVRIMIELAPEGEGADRERVVRALAEMENISLERAEERIQDALMAGLCYESGDDLVPI